MGPLIPKPRKGRGGWPALIGFSALIGSGCGGGIDHSASKAADYFPSLVGKGYKYEEVVATSKIGLVLDGEVVGVEPAEDGWLVRIKYVTSGGRATSVSHFSVQKDRVLHVASDMEMPDKGIQRHDETGYTLFILPDSTGKATWPSMSSFGDEPSRSVYGSVKTKYKKYEDCLVVTGISVLGLIGDPPTRTHHFFAKGVGLVEVRMETMDGETVNSSVLIDP